MHLKHNSGQKPRLLLMSLCLVFLLHGAGTTNSPIQATFQSLCASSSANVAVPAFQTRTAKSTDVGLPSRCLGSQLREKLTSVRLTFAPSAPALRYTNARHSRAAGLEFAALNSSCYVRSATLQSQPGVLQA